MVQGKTPVKKILYISYDGMTDPLGQSQIIPYLQGLSKLNYRFTILSFEKPERFAKQEAHIRSLLEPYSIEWVPLRFTRRPPLLSKFYDAIRMRQTAFKLHRREKFDMVHCRSYIASDIGLRMKKKFGIKFFFDMRGFWADEKKDGGAWNTNSPVFSRVYKYYKKKEAEYLQHADHIISLTDAGKNELITWDSYNKTVPVSVIPCCADMNHFTITDAEQKKRGRETLGLPPDAFVLSYLGSVGAWYMLDEMLELFAVIRKQYPSAIFLFVTHSDAEMIKARAAHHGIPGEAMKILEASRAEVPAYIKASDVNVSFIKPVYSKISSSPTKLGEVLSMGIPVVVNSGVGDVEAIVKSNDCGIVIHDFTPATYEKVVQHIPSLLQKDAAGIRNRIAPVFSLANGVAMYTEAYRQVFDKKK
jgi:glycosyltransferase involved in cell wall biosynthesis